MPTILACIMPCLLLSRFLMKAWIIAHTLYPQLLMLKHLVQSNDTWIEFAESFSSLIDEHEDAIELRHMGLPDDWKPKLSHVLQI